MWSLLTSYVSRALRVSTISFALSAICCQSYGLVLRRDEDAVVARRFSAAKLDAGHVQVVVPHLVRRGARAGSL
jgi:hypothetical protein